MLTKTIVTKAMSKLYFMDVLLVKRISSSSIARFEQKNAEESFESISKNKHSSEKQFESNGSKSAKDRVIDSVTHDRAGDKTDKDTPIVGSIKSLKEKAKNGLELLSEKSEQQHTPTEQQYFEGNRDVLDEYEHERNTMTKRASQTLDEAAHRNSVEYQGPDGWDEWKENKVQT